MKRIAYLMFLGALALHAACSDGTIGQLNPNQPPTVWLAAGPPEGSTGTYRVQMYWGGWDPDGEIAGYEYIVTDNESGTFDPADTVEVDWNPVSGNDSTFTFSADQPVDTLDTDDQISVFTRSHTFFIRAIDSQNARSTAAHRSFTARTLSPEVVVDIPNRVRLDPAELPSVATFRWRAFDYVNDTSVKESPDSVQWVLKSTADFGGNFTNTIKYLQDYRKSAKDWFPWVWYNAPGDSGKFWTTPPVDLGTYIFAIRAKDEAGAVTPVLDEENNVRRVRVRQLKTGPLMKLSNEYMGEVRWANCAPSLLILDSPAGVSLEFKVSGEADHYGGTVVGYRYGWDIPDLNDPEQWEIDLTPFVTAEATIPGRTFNFGTHTLTAEIMDNSGYCTRIQVKVNIVPFTLERSLLIVDDDTTDDQPASGWANGGSYPNDAEHDAFWLQMASDVSGFDPQVDMVDTRLDALPLTLLAQYKSIIWNVYADNSKLLKTLKYPLLYSFIKYRSKNPADSQSTGKVYPNVLALAMAAGSHIMIAGRHPVHLTINRAELRSDVRFPVIWLYDLEGEQATVDIDAPPKGNLSFAYRELCLETMDYALQKTTLWRRATGQNRDVCPVSTVRKNGNLPAVEREVTMREAISIDPHFPTMALRNEAAALGQWYDPAVRGLDAEIYNPFYFQRSSGLPGSCRYVTAPRPCFSPVYGLGCIDTTELTYHQPVAFWTSAFADRVAPDVPGAVGAKSIVFGFPPVFFEEEDFQPAMNHILFDEWKLPRNANMSAGR